jgi:D-sedoheptulose 7-phosphate isomerase
MLIQFENIENKFEKAVTSESYYELVEKIKKANRIYVIGNGGLHFVASHMATDMSRLIENKAVYSFDSVGYITSNSNDHGFSEVFTRWLETITKVDKPNESLVIGLSCSGNSSNVIGALHWAQNEGIDTFMISGQKSEILKEQNKELIFNCEYFHTVEVLCMMLFYELIHSVGSHCPSITKEKKRMGNSYLRSLKKEEK